MTVHCSKGLEYPVVFLTGMEENLFPHSNCLESEPAVEEERRLCYVGITRAMNRLYMTSAELRRSYAGVDYRSPSRFLFEIDPSLLVRVYHEDENGMTSDRMSAAQRVWTSKISPDAGTSNTAPMPTSVSEELFKSDSNFKVKDRVRHPKYGVGRIVAVDGTGDNLKLGIAFDKAGMKTFMEKYTPLEKM